MLGVTSNSPLEDPEREHDAMAASSITLMTHLILRPPSVGVLYLIRALYLVFNLMC